MNLLITRFFSERVITLHRLCRDIDIKDVDTVLPWVEDCIGRHWKRHDFRSLLIAHGMSRTEYYELKDMTEVRALGILKEFQKGFYIKLKEKMDRYHEAVRRIAGTACEYIRTREPKVRKVRIREREDKSTGKIRMIGSESAMQQVLDYIAVGAAMQIFERRIVPQQVSSVKGRGQIYGTKMIHRWIERDNRSARYAKRHGIRYARKCKYFVKLDIKKCYNNAKREIFMKLFQRDCGNDDLIWLWWWLLGTHRVDGNTGFMIGALPSQWGVRYMLSFAYRYAKDLHVMRREKSIRMINHMILFMDDMTLFSGNRKYLKKAVGLLTGFIDGTLGFSIKPEWHIKEIDREGVDMMGYVVYSNGKIAIRSRDFIRARRMVIRRMRGEIFILKQALRAMSFKGFFDHSDSRMVEKKYGLQTVFRYAAMIISKAERRNNTKKKEEKRYVYKQCAI